MSLHPNQNPRMAQNLERMNAKPGPRTRRWMGWVFIAGILGWVIGFLSVQS